MTPLTIARDYIARGWSVIPVPYRKKGPVLEGWQKLKITSETADQYFNARKMNIGVLLGEASHGLRDADLDCAEAIAAAPHILPPTAIFGRQSAPQSHWLYNSDIKHDKATIKFTDPRRAGDSACRAQARRPGSCRANGFPRLHSRTR